MPDDVQPDVSEAELASPPPSKVEPELAGLVADMLLVVDVPCMSGSFGTQAPRGLNPPGSISVAPSGTPVPPSELEPSIPSGEVAPIPGTVVALWARAAPQPSRIMIVITHARRIGMPPVVDRCNQNTRR